MIDKQIEDYIAVAQTVREPQLRKAVLAAIALSHKALQGGHKILVAGNGGSAADAQHFAAEFLGRFKRDRAGYAAIALTTDTSFLTAWSNDHDFESVFARGVEALGQKGDVFVGISTSGNSENIIRALAQAKTQGLSTIALLGGTGGRAKGIADLDIAVPSLETPRIQEVQMFILHTIAEEVEELMSASKSTH